MYCLYAAVYHSHNYPLKTYFRRYYDEFKGIYQVYQWKMFASTKGIVRQILALDKQDIRYILNRGNKIPRKLYWLHYALVRNRYRCIGAYLAGIYEELPQVLRDYLDIHISQQYEQINGTGRGKNMTKSASCFWRNIVRSTVRTLKCIFICQIWNMDMRL